MNVSVSARRHKRNRIHISRYKRKQHRNRNSSQNGGKRWSLKYKKSINCNRPRGFSQRQYCKYGAKTPSKSKSKTMRFNQSGGDILNHFPSDVTMTLRSIGDSFSNVVDSVKGFAPAPSSLPYNDHKLQKTEVAFSERIPDIAAYYKNAMNLIPAL
jgi:hypothetical protein